MKLTQRGRDVLWVCRFMAVLLLGLALVGTVGAL
jgi:hypothetical protein